MLGSHLKTIVGRHVTCYKTNYYLMGGNSFGNMLAFKYKRNELIDFFFQNIFKEGEMEKLVIFAKFLSNTPLGGCGRNLFLKFSKFKTMFRDQLYELVLKSFEIIY